MRAFTLVIACLVALAAAVPENMMEDRIMRRECVRTPKIVTMEWIEWFDQLTNLDLELLVLRRKPLRRSGVLCKRYLLKRIRWRLNTGPVVFSLVRGNLKS